MANKHEINGYIYVTSNEEIKDCYYIDLAINMILEAIYPISNKYCKKIILCNNPNLPIQQLTTEEVEYLKVVDSFEVKKNYLVGYYIIPQENVKIFSTYSEYFDKYPKEQTKESIEEVAEKWLEIEDNYNLIDNQISFKIGVEIGYNHAKQTLYTEEEVELIANEMVNWTIDNIGNPNPESGKKFDEVLNKHKKQ